jgi:hypothetical protein
MDVCLCLFVCRLSSLSLAVSGGLGTVTFSVLAPVSGSSTDFYVPDPPLGYASTVSFYRVRVWLLFLRSDTLSYLCRTESDIECGDHQCHGRTKYGDEQQVHRNECGCICDDDE